MNVLKFKDAVKIGRYKSRANSTRISHLGSSEKWFGKPNLFVVCPDFNNISLKIRAKAIS